MATTRALGLSIAIVVGLLTLDVAGPFAFVAVANAKFAKSQTKFVKPHITAAKTTTRTVSSSGSSTRHVGGTSRTTFARHPVTGQQLHHDVGLLKRDNTQIHHDLATKTQLKQVKFDAKQEQQIKSTDPKAFHDFQEQQLHNGTTNGGQTGTGGTNSTPVNKVVRSPTTYGPGGTPVTTLPVGTTPPIGTTPPLGTGTPIVTNNPPGGPTGTTPPLKKGPGPSGPVTHNGPSGPKGPVIRLAGGNFPFVAGPKRIWRDGGWKSFVPFAALGAVALGGGYYYPTAYVSVARNYCGGLTPEGCHLNWQMVGFEGGGSAYQCVQFCRRDGGPVPQHVVQLAPPPPASNGRCEIAIFADPGFGGASSEATSDEPNLDEAGWKDQISSVQVKAGVWDFFSDDQFQGESMRLLPGPHPQLGPDWTKHSGSFMCVQGS